MDKKIILFAILFSLLLGGVAFAAEPAKRMLEITYPDIPGVPTPKYVDVGLPNYVNYIFRFAIVFFGLLILGVLIYNGVIYLLSFGNPSKLSDARQGMVAALFGGIILFGAFIVFNTINPQLVILELPTTPLIKAVVMPGVYLCNYSVPGIDAILNNYMSGNLEARKNAAIDLKNAMGKPEKLDKVCFLVNFSGILTNFEIRPSSSQTIFIIPEETYNQATAKFEWKYNYGMVLHETDKFTGKCKLLPSPATVTGESGLTVYHQIDNYRANIDFTAKAITVFKRPVPSPLPDSEAVVLYEGLAFNEIAWSGPKKGAGEVCTADAECVSNFCGPPDPAGTRKCLAPKPSLLPLAWAAVDPNYLRIAFSPGEAAVRIVNENELRTQREAGSRKTNLYHNARSIEIKPKNGFIAILWGDENKADTGEKNEKCEVRKTDDANLMDDSIGRCGTCGIVGWATNWTGLTSCYPCLEYLIVVKGQSL